MHRCHRWDVVRLASFRDAPAIKKRIFLSVPLDGREGKASDGKEVKQRLPFISVNKTSGWERSKDGPFRLKQIKGESGHSLIFIYIFSHRLGEKFSSFVSLIPWSNKTTFCCLCSLRTLEKGDFKWKVNKHINNISQASRRAVLNEIYGWHNAKAEGMNYSRVQAGWGEMCILAKLHQHKSSIRKWNKQLQVEILPKISSPVNVFVCVRDLPRTSEFYEQQHVRIPPLEVAETFFVFYFTGWISNKTLKVIFK